MKFAAILTDINKWYPDGSGPYVVKDCGHKHKTPIAAWSCAVKQWSGTSDIHRMTVGYYQADGTIRRYRAE